MKKIIATVMALVCIMTMAACGRSGKDNINNSPLSFEDAVEYTAEALITEYQNGNWNGEFINNGKHCASIEDGNLWIDCSSTAFYPDVDVMDHVFSSVIHTDHRGTWFYEPFHDTLELWLKGKRLQRIKITGGNVLYSEGLLVSCEGTNIVVYSETGTRLEELNNIIDVYQDKIGKIYLSNFEHKNFVLEKDGSLSELETSYVRFTRHNESIEKSSNSKLLTQVFNLYCGTDWDGECKVVDGNFVSVGYYDGSIIINNKVRGHIALGTEYIAKEGANIMFDDEHAYYLNGDKFITLKKGKETSVDIPDGDAEFVWHYTDRTVIMIYGNQTNTLIIVDQNGNVKTVSEKCVDANVAYDTLYYMEDDTVYRLSWEEADASPEIYFRGAYAVSPGTDESEGAIVSDEYANWPGNVFSPYGKDTLK